MNATRRQAVTFSVIVPLHDCRDAGTDALRAAVAQTFSRERYGVIAVVDGSQRASAHLARWFHIGLEHRHET